jgi:hypothetical protein
LFEFELKRFVFEKGLKKEKEKEKKKPHLLTFRPSGPLAHLPLPRSGPRLPLSYSFPAVAHTGAPSISPPSSSFLPSFSSALSDGAPPQSSPCPTASFLFPSRLSQPIKAINPRLQSTVVFHSLYSLHAQTIRRPSMASRQPPHPLISPLPPSI